MPAHEYMKFFRQNEIIVHMEPASIQHQANKFSFNVIILWKLLHQTCIRKYTHKNRFLICFSFVYFRHACQPPVPPILCMCSICITSYKIVYTICVRTYLYRCHKTTHFDVYVFANRKWNHKFNHSKKNYFVYTPLTHPLLVNRWDVYLPATFLIGMVCILCSTLPGLYVLCMYIYKCMSPSSA